MPRFSSCRGPRTKSCVPTAFDSNPASHAWSNHFPWTISDARSGRCYDGRQGLVVINERVLAEGAAGRRSGDEHLPSARPERGRLAMVELTDGDRLVLL